MSMVWEKNAQDAFEQMVAKIPVFMRPIAKEAVSKKAEALAAGQNRSAVTEQDMVDAFFAATPFGFHGPMKVDMESLGIDYTKYGHQR